MKRSDKLRLALVILIGCLVILTVFWFRFGNSGDDSRDGDIDMMQQEIASHAGSGSSADSDNDHEEDVTAVSGASSSVDPADNGISGQAASQTASTVTPIPVNTTMDISGNSLYRSEEIIADGESGKYTPESAEHVLQELRGFWESVGEDALKDLWVLDRYQKMFVQLDKMDVPTFFYSGDKNEEGLPEGRGIAVYGGYRCYLGEWKDGKREGAGDWYQFYPEGSGSRVSVHAYTGSWKNDLPSGQGMDRYEYYTEKLDEESHYPLNVIGNFTDGLYDGEMYVILLRQGDVTENWYGTCTRGVWQPIGGKPNADGKIPALYKEDSPELQITILPKLNSGYGVDHVQ